MSRQPLWDTACKLQADMFREAAAIGGLDVQLVYYRGIAECRASRLGVAGERLARADGRASTAAAATPRSARCSPMRAPRPSAARCRRWCLSATPWRRRSTTCAGPAGELGLLGVPAFMFQEGYDAIAEQAFREIARLTKGAYCRFDPGAAQQLGELLRAVAAYAAGGMKALADLSARRDPGAIKLIGADEITMGAIIFGVLALAVVLLVAARLQQGQSEECSRSC